jgi:hypothetical protein
MVLEVGYVGNYAHDYTRAMPRTRFRTCIPWEVRPCQGLQQRRECSEARPLSSIQTSPLPEALGAVAGFACGPCTQKLLHRACPRASPQAVSEMATVVSLLNLTSGKACHTEWRRGGQYVVDSYVIGATAILTTMPAFWPRKQNLFGTYF